MDITKKHPDALLLMLMLSSDQTIVYGNNKHKLWPIYLTLGNIPKHLRNKSKYNTNLVLAFLPVINFKKEKKYKAWISAARLCTFQYSMSLIFSPFIKPKRCAYEMKGPFGKIYQCYPILFRYSTDFPEQYTLACTGGVNLEYGCPRCFVPTINFKYYFSKEELEKHKKTTINMKNLLEASKNLTDSNEYLKRYGIKNSECTFWNIPNFDIYGALCVDDLHQLGGAYKYILTAIEKPNQDAYQKTRLQESYEHHIDLYLLSTTTASYQLSFKSPKIHMLNKYTNDIQKKGPLIGYSTQHSEHMHSTKAASYIEIKDVIVDNYKESDHDTESPPDNANYSLQSFVKDEKSINDVVIQCRISVNSASLIKHIYKFLGDYLYGCNFILTDTQPTIKFKLYKALKIKYKYNENITNEIIYANNCVHGKDRCDYIKYITCNGDRYGKALALVSLEFENGFFDICISDSLSIKHNDIHPTGYTVLKKSDSLFIRFVKDIKHLAFVVPDFPSRLGDDLYKFYLVNHDINIHSFMEAMSNQLLTVPPYQLVKWKYKIVEESENDGDYVESENEDDSNEEEANDDEDDETEGGEEDY
ncbi:unnamed protein product [Cunninghamella echinulata]